MAARRARPTERLEVLVVRLKELREGGPLGLDEPKYVLSPEDPLCVALGVPRGFSVDKRREMVRNGLIDWIDRLQEERLRDALRVAYNLHPDFHHTAEMSKDKNAKVGVKERREKYAAQSSYQSAMTVYRDENKAIEQLAQWFEHEPNPLGLIAMPLRELFGIHAKHVRILSSGQAITVGTVWLFRLMGAIMFLVLLIWLGSMMHWFYIGKF